MGKSRRGEKGGQLEAEERDQVRKRRRRQTHESSAKKEAFKQHRVYESMSPSGERKEEDDQLRSLWRRSKKTKPTFVSLRRRVRLRSDEDLLEKRADLGAV